MTTEQMQEERVRRDAALARLQDAERDRDKAYENAARVAQEAEREEQKAQARVLRAEERVREARNQLSKLVSVEHMAEVERQGRESVTTGRRKGRSA